MMITLENVGKEYGLMGGGVKALDGVSLTIGRGEYAAIMGPSGSGKSTLLHILGILDSASSGSYLLEGYDITSLPDRESARIRSRHFGFVFQGFDLFPELSALENVMLPMSYAGLSCRRRRQRAELLLEEMGLAHRLQHQPAMMSEGEQQRVAIARALANDPDLILADEPTGDLPSDAAEEIMQAIESLNVRGVTIVMATRSPDLGWRAKRRLAIHGGRLEGPAGNERATGGGGHA
jgi:putative ABC transport system ATP-binding protein